MRSKSILIIDRKQFLGRSWKLELSKKHDVLLCETLSHFEKQFIDLIIINMHSQKELDLNIFRRLSQAMPSVPILVISSYRCWSKAELMSWGVSNVVVKPFLISVLEQKIGAVLSNQVTCMVD